MEEHSYNEFKDKYTHFKKQLSKNINNSSILNGAQECYLIEDSWFTKLKDFSVTFNNLQKNNKNDNELNSISILQKNIPNFINNISTAINCLKTKQKFQLINSQLIESIYNKNDLKSHKIITYYSGNNKLIIEFKDNNNKAILLLNPLDDINKKIYIVIKNDDQNNLYEELLNKNSEFYNELERNYKGENIIPFKIYINIFELFLSVFKYEKSFSEKKDNIFKTDEKYFLINSEWLNKFKQYYGYHHLIELINNKKKKNENFDLNNNKALEEFINEIIINEKNLNSIINEEINPKTIKIDNNYLYYIDCYILNSYFYEAIKNIFGNKEINNNDEIEFIKEKNNEIYLIFSRKIIIGYFNEKLSFFPKYLLFCCQEKKLKSEIKIILQNSLEEYLKSFKKY